MNVLCSIRTRIAAALAVALFAVAFDTSVHATVLAPTDLGELARDANAIAHGRIVAMTAQWTAGRRSIETLVTLEADTYLKGGLGGTVTFRVPGGVMGRYRSVVMGAPQFAIGQEVIVFLGAQGPTVPYVLGLNQGVFRIVAQANGAVVIPPAAVPGVTGTLVRGAASRTPEPVAQFEARVRGLAGGAR